jgi:hypothetical protein
MANREKNCQIRMSSSLWNLIGEIAQELGYHDARGRHSTVIREMVTAAAATWTHSPYVCRSARHTIYVTKQGNIFSRQVEILRLNAQRLRLPCVMEMKPEKRDDYHRMYRKREGRPKDAPIGVHDEFQWFQEQWLLNHFAVWNGKRDDDALESFNQGLLSSHVDTFGPTSKSADLAVDAMGGRLLTREIVIGLQDYVQWKDVPSSSIFDRIDIPIDVPTSNLEVCVVVDLDLFSATGQEDEIANLALEFRNRESARFEGREVALYPEIRIEEQYGRSLKDDGADAALLKVRRLWQRFSTILESTTSRGVRVADYANRDLIASSLKLPKDFLFYWLRWPSPHLGIEACVRWEKPVRP